MRSYGEAEDVDDHNASNAELAEIAETLDAAPQPGEGGPSNGARTMADDMKSFARIRRAAVIGLHGRPAASSVL